VPKLVCHCGHIIVDQSFDVPYKADYFADGDYESSFGRLIAWCAEFVQTSEAGKQGEFLARHLGDRYPQDLTVADIIGDMVGGLLASFGHEMFECEQCGRLWLQPTLGKDKFVSYLPETGIRGVLRPWKPEEEH
jgi:hypothetical protein